MSIFDYNKKAREHFSLRKKRFAVWTLGLVLVLNVVWPGKTLAADIPAIFGEGRWVSGYGLHLSDIRATGATLGATGKFDDGKPMWLKVTVLPDILRSKEYFGKATAPAMPNYGNDKLGDEMKGWASEGGGGSLVVRRGQCVIEISGGEDLDKLVKIAGEIDDSLKQAGAGTLQAEIAALKDVNAGNAVALSAAEKAKKAAELIKEMDQETDPEKHSKLLYQIGGLKLPETVPVIISNLNPRFDVVTRQGAIKILGDMHDKRAIPPLEAFLGQPVPASADLGDGGPPDILRREAVKALGRIGDPSVIPFLEKIAADEKDYVDVRSWAGVSAESLKKKNE